MRGNESLEVLKGLKGVVCHVQNCVANTLSVATSEVLLEQVFYGLTS